MENQRSQPTRQAAVATGAGAKLALIGSPSFGTLECDSDPVAYDPCPDGSFSYIAGAGFSGFDSRTAGALFETPSLIRQGEHDESSL